MSRQYITTAIDFPNGDPHMGHVLEKVLADVYARWSRLRGDETRFQIGTDDHGIKIQQTAERLGKTPQELLAENIPKFEDLFQRMNISYDFFVSTSLTEGHYATAQGLWNKLAENGYLEKRTYTGLYCVGCESFVMKRDLVDGKCVNHGTEPEEISEENWFFLLSKLQEYLNDLVDDEHGSYRIVPSYRGNEVRAFLEQGLEDVSFSRPRSTLYWGVPVPGEEDQVMYVWCDNLTNYMSTLGYLTESEDPTWWDDAEVTHVIGKDIARFHGLNWPAMLHAAGVQTPNRLLVHGFLTVDGGKMSKSVGNVVVPEDTLDRCGGNPDPIRFYLSHEIPVGRDGDFSWKRFDELYDAKLRNQLGNLLNRVLVLLQKQDGTLASFDTCASDTDRQCITECWEYYRNAMNGFAFHDALGPQGVFRFMDYYNQQMDIQKPWEKDDDEKRALLTIFAEGLRHAALMLLPFMPDTAQRISTQLNVPYAHNMTHKDFVLTDEMMQWGGMKKWKNVGTPEILFAPIEEG